MKHLLIIQVVLLVGVSNIFARLAGKEYFISGWYIFASIMAFVIAVFIVTNQGIRKI